MHRADPGQVFPTDSHRRVLAYLPQPGEDAQSTPALCERIAEDANVPFEDLETLRRILTDLATSGDAEEVESGYWRLAADGFDRLNGSNGDEPPPLKGERLKRAEREDAELEDRQAALDERVRRERVERAEAELETAKADLP